MESKWTKIMGSVVDKFAFFWGGERVFLGRFMRNLISRAKTREIKFDHCDSLRSCRQIQFKDARIVLQINTFEHLGAGGDEILAESIVLEKVRGTGRRTPGGIRKLDQRERWGK
jgi:hypothetical protein